MDSQYTLEKKYKLRNIALYNHDESENSNLGKSSLIKAFHRSIEGFMIC